MNITIKEPSQPAKLCIIWMHGLGADAADMESLASQYPINSLPARHVCINAPMRPVTLNGGMMMRAWYDITGINLIDREDEEGIPQSQEMINAIIQEQTLAGFATDQIILAGFSQGGAMALYTALHHSEKLAGVIALSAYLPLAYKCQYRLAKTTPIFVGLGRLDTIVLPEWTRFSANLLQQQGYKNLSLHDYPMQHSICAEELFDLSQWLHNILARETI